QVCPPVAERCAVLLPIRACRRCSARRTHRKPFFWWHGSPSRLLFCARFNGTQLSSRGDRESLAMHLRPWWHQSAAIEHVAGSIRTSDPPYVTANKPHWLSLHPPLASIVSWGETSWLAATAGAETNCVR